MMISRYKKVDTSVDMSNIVRACNPFDFGLILTLSHNRFTGPLSNAFNTVLDFIEAKGNVTVSFRSQQDGIGEPIRSSSLASYDGCIGLLQRNESDFHDSTDKLSN